MSEKITFRELVERIAEETKQSNTAANSFISELVDLIELSLRDGQPISISGFGKFELRWMNKRKGTHPRTGEEILIPGQNKVVFKPFKALKERVNSSFTPIEPSLKEIEKEKDTPEVEELSIITDTVPEQPTDEIIPVTIAEDLLYEREIPEHLKQKDSPAARSARPPKKKKSLSPNEDTVVKQVPLSDMEKKPPQPKTTSLREVYEKSHFNWSMVAAGMLVMLGFLLFFYLSQQQSEPNVVLFEPENIEIPFYSLPELPQQTNQIPEPEPVPVQPETVSPDESFSKADVFTQPGESLWLLAEREMGNPLLWPAIYFLNKDLLENPNELPLRITIQIPQFSDSENLNRMERHLVSKGYLELYHWNLRTAPNQARYFLWAAAIFSEEVISQSSEPIREEDLRFALNR